MDLTYIVAGALVGVVVGATGVGGGSLMTPLLIFAFGVKPQVAVGTDLLFAAITKFGGTWAHAKRGHVNWRIAGWMMGGSVPASAVTLWFLHQYGTMSDTVTTAMKTALGVALIVTAAALWIRKHVAQWGKRFTPEFDGQSPRPVPTLILGAVIGCMVTLTSVGAGAIGTTALFFLYPLLPASRIVGTDVAYAVPLTLVAGLGHATLGHIDWPLLAALVMGSLPGIWLGSSIAARAPEWFLRALLSTLLTLIGARLIV
jgi:uncharacterized membrane protein YfcA